MSIIFGESIKSEYEVTVMVCTYYPEFEKLITTINSCLLQQQVDMQIVISDDGTQGLEYERIIDFFKKNNFYDYIFVMSEKNCGTVKNVINGLNYCKGKYTKLISPGDYLYKYNTLKSWIDLVNKEHAVVGFSKCIHYQYEGEKIVPIETYVNPYENKHFYKGLWEYNYLIFDDIAVGAATITKTDELKEYCKYIENKLIYAEDNIFRIMAFNHERASYFDSNSILYEHGTGISTNNNPVWGRRILQDWNSADDIMLSNIIKGDELHRVFFRLVQSRRLKNPFIKRIKLLFVRGRAFFYVKKKIKKRVTNTMLDEDYIMKLTTIKC